FRVVFEISSSFGAEVERGIIIGVRRHLRSEIGMKHLTSSQPGRIERLGRERDGASKIFSEARKIHYVPVGRGQLARIAGEDEIEAATARGEIRLRIIEDERRARIVEDATIRRIECS